MNRLELLIYNRVKHDPRLKKRIVDAYQRVCSWVPLPRERAAYPIHARRGFFFGFHDKVPWSADDRYLAAHRVSIPLRMPTPDDATEVGYFSGAAFDEFHSVGHTRAWNWQMGAQLQWVGREHHLLYNDFDGTKHVARIVDLEGRTRTVLPCPIGALSPDGRFAVSHSFTRLRPWSSGYGYATGFDPDADVNIPTARERGLRIVDVSSGRVHDLFSVAEIARHAPEASMEGAYHFFSHPLVNPSGTRFVFFHRWLVEGNRLWTRMLSCDWEGRGLYVFPTAGMVSHIAWRDDRHILAYATTRDQGDRWFYALFEDQADRYVPIGTDQFNSDGHPQFATGGRWFVTDTYADRFRVQNLILFDMASGRRYDIAHLRSPLRFADDVHCDLHPRWNRAGTMVCFDSTHLGERSLCTIEVGPRDDGVPRTVRS